MIDDKLSFKGHLGHAREKAVNISSSLTRLISNIEGSQTAYHGGGEIHLDIRGPC